MQSGYWNPHSPICAINATSLQQKADTNLHLANGAVMREFK